MSVYENAKQRRTDAPQWKKKLAKELLRRKFNRFPRRGVYTKNVDEIWTADLMDMQRFSRVNRGFKYILVVLDVFSRFAWARPLKTKTGKEMAAALREIFQQGRIPAKLWTDKGTEFWNKNVRYVLHGPTFHNKDVSGMLKANNVELYSTNNEPKAMISERFIRTLRGKIESNYIITHSTVWYDILPFLIHEYNTTRHRSIGMTPTDACKPVNFSRVYKSQFKKKALTRKPLERPILNIGDKVRTTILKNIFDKGTTPNWTEEIFEISKIVPGRPITYRIKDLTGEELEGIFYTEQLQVTDQEIYRVDRVLRRRKKRDGTREAYVSWMGYPSKFNQWIPEDDIHVGGR